MIGPNQGKTVFNNRCCIDKIILSWFQMVRLIIAWIIMIVIPFIWVHCEGLFWFWINWSSHHQICKSNKLFLLKPICFVLVSHDDVCLTHMQESLVQLFDFTLCEQILIYTTLWYMTHWFIINATAARHKRSCIDWYLHFSSVLIFVSTFNYIHEHWLL